MSRKFLTVVLILTCFWVVVDKNYACVTKPVADLEVSPEYVIIGEEVTLDGTGSIDGTYPIDEYYWDFEYSSGDDYWEIGADGSDDDDIFGLTSTTYSSKGPYTVGLRVVDEGDNWDLDIIDTKVYVVKVIYVDDDASGPTFDGSSWEHAYQDLQAALTEAESGDEIWVAEGTYEPGTAQTDSFVLKNGVGIYGGFAGTETKYAQRDTRDYVSNVTILSGDIDPDDEDDSFHVVTAGSGTDSSAVLDGFIITGGEADGGGQYNYGGGMFNDGGSPTINNCTFIDNMASSGGGMYNTNGSPTLDNCRFIGNSASTYGGGMYNDDDASPYNTSPILTNCTFIDNSASYGGGMCAAYSNPMVTDCMFLENGAGNRGGAVFIGAPSDSTTFTRCIFIRNKATAVGSQGGGIAYEFGTLGTFSATLKDCVFFDNFAKSGGGVSNRLSVSLALTNCIFSGNSAVNFGGSIFNFNRNLAVTNCTLSRNYSDNDGGGIYYYANISSRTIEMTNCILWGNTDDDGSTTKQEEQIFVDTIGSTTVEHSCIEDGSPGSAPFPYDGSANDNIDTDPSLVDSENPAGPDNTFGTADDGLQLQAGVSSPCIDAGDGYSSSTSINTESVDLCGTNRFMDGDYDDPEHTIDMGAYETPCVWFVKMYTSSGDNGETWNTAFDELSSALDPLINTELEADDEIWVATETYTPSTSDPNPRKATFQLVENVSVYGGFAGAEVRRYQRDWVDNQTTLSGDIGTAAPEDNCYHVVKGADNMILDGFIITGGNAEGTYDGFGGGMFNDSASPEVANCIFRDNTAEKAGGGMFNFDSSPTLTNCIFSNNSADDGGGIFSAAGECNLTLKNCVFTGNTATWGGGLYNCSAYDNEIKFINCTLSGNDAEADEGGGGMLNLECSLFLVNCILYGNTAGAEDDEDEIHNYYSSTSIRYCDIYGCGGSPDKGGTWNPNLGIDCGGNIDVEPDFFDESTPAGDDGDFMTVDDGLQLGSDSPCIDAADGDFAPLTDIVSRLRIDVTTLDNTGTGIPDYSDIGAYEYAPYLGPWVGLLAGGSKHNSGVGGVVYHRVPIDSQWQIISGELGEAVLSLCKYNGNIYAGTKAESGQEAKVFKWLGGTTWEDVSVDQWGSSTVTQVSGLAVLDDNLYASTLGDYIFMYNGNSTWTRITGVPTWGPSSTTIYSWNGHLYLGNYSTDYIDRYDGSDGEGVMRVSGSCIYDFETYQNRIYACAYAYPGNEAPIYSSDDGSNGSWSIAGGIDNGNHAWEMEVFQNLLYIGVGPHLWTYDESDFTQIMNDEQPWEPADGHVLSMAVQGGFLFIGCGNEARTGYGQGNEGNVYIYDTPTFIEFSDGIVSSGIQCLLPISGD